MYVLWVGYCWSFSQGPASGWENGVQASRVRGTESSHRHWECNLRVSGCSLIYSGRESMLCSFGWPIRFLKTISKPAIGCSSPGRLSNISSHILGPTTSIIMSMKAVPGHELRMPTVYNVCVIYHDTNLEVRGQFCGVSSLLHPYVAPHMYLSSQACAAITFICWASSSWPLLLDVYTYIFFTYLWFVFLFSYPFKKRPIFILQCLSDCLDRYLH